MFRALPLLILPLLYSFAFSPMSQSIEVGSGKRGAQFLVENDSNTNTAVELTVKERVMDQDGKETLKETSDITILPPQIIIPPGEKRTIRVNYMNKDLPAVEKNYRVIAEQLPLNVDPKTKNQAGIKMLMKYVAALYVSPADTKSELKVISYSTNGEEMKLTLENTGARHQLLTNPKIKFLHDGKKGEIKASELPGLAGENVLAGHKRNFIIKTKQTIPAGARVEIRVDD